jgi:hypothetical protein
MFIQWRVAELRQFLKSLNNRRVLRSEFLDFSIFLLNIDSFVMFGNVVDGIVEIRVVFRFDAIVVRRLAVLCLRRNRILLVALVVAVVVKLVVVVGVFVPTMLLVVVVVVVVVGGICYKIRFHKSSPTFSTHNNKLSNEFTSLIQYNLKNFVFNTISQNVLKQGKQTVIEKTKSHSPISNSITRLRTI